MDLEDVPELEALPELAEGNGGAAPSASASTASAFRSQHHAIWRILPLVSGLGVSWRGSLRSDATHSFLVFFHPEERRWDGPAPKSGAMPAALRLEARSTEPT